MAIVAFVTGCTNAASAASPSPTTVADSSPGAAYCSGVDLRTSNGNQLDLTGTWFGEDDQTYYSFIQVGSCVRAVGSDGPHVSDRVLIIDGTIGPDFTIAVEYAHIPVSCNGAFCAGEVGTATLEIEIGADGEVIALRKMGGNTADQRGSNLGVTRWTRVDGEAVGPSPTPAE